MRTRDFMVLMFLLTAIQSLSVSDVPQGVVYAGYNAETRALFRVKVTSYRSIPAQTDDSPWITSNGHRTSQEGIAVSQDLLKRGIACYGDVVMVPGVGYRVVNDVMAVRHKTSMDVWMLTLEDERRFGVRRLDVQVIKSPNRYCRKGD